MKYISVAIAATCLWGFQAAAQPTSASMSSKHTGKTMKQIENTLGEPSRRFQPVGQPPIIRWQYADQTVYFEHDRVIHTVKHKK